MVVNYCFHFCGAAIGDFVAVSPKDLVEAVENAYEVYF